MKRNLYRIFIVLFILAACVPIPQRLDQAATATQEATVTTEPTSTWTPEPTPSPTPEGIKLINTISLKEFPKFKEYSRITLEDFTSGKLLELERKWLEENPFPEDAVPLTNLKFKEVPTGMSATAGSERYFDIDTYNVQFFLGNVDYSDPSTRPMKVISYYVLWDEKFFDSIGITDEVIIDNRSYGVEEENKYASLGIMTWAWLNPDGSTVICHSLINFGNGQIIENDGNGIIMPLVDVYNYKENIPENSIVEFKSIFQIYLQYPELKPLDLSKEWVRTKIMPEEMQNKLFGVAPISSKW